MQEKFDRKSNFELLRIIAMLMIIGYHYVIHGQGTMLEGATLPSRVYLECFSMFGKIGVNLFVLVSGYFGILSHFKIEKIIRIEFECLFYSILFMIIFGVFGKNTFSVIGTFKSLFPTIFNQYWFMTAYIVLYLFSPFLNKLLLLLSKSEYQKLILLIIILWSVIPTFTLQLDNGLNWTQQIWMFAMYIFGGYFRKFPIMISRRKRNIVLILSVFSLLGSVWCFEIIGTKIPLIKGHATYFGWSNSILAVTVTVMLFLSFQHCKIKQCKVINYLASAAFSVYLFHENIFVKNWLWKDFLQCGTQAVLWKYILHSVIAIMSIYAIGTILMIIYRVFYDKFLYRYIVKMQTILLKS